MDRRVSRMTHLPFLIRSDNVEPNPFHADSAVSNQLAYIVFTTTDPYSYAC